MKAYLNMVEAEGVQTNQFGGDKVPMYFKGGGKLVNWGEGRLFYLF